LITYNNVSTKISDILFFYIFFFMYQFRSKDNLNYLHINRKSWVAQIYFLQHKVIFDFFNSFWFEICKPWLFWSNRFLSVFLSETWQLGTQNGNVSNKNVCESPKILLILQLCKCQNNKKKLLFCSLLKQM
jgi:hypothetical protein